MTQGKYSYSGPRRIWLTNQPFVWMDFDGIIMTIGVLGAALFGAIFAFYLAYPGVFSGEGTTMFITRTLAQFSWIFVGAGIGLSAYTYNEVLRRGSRRYTVRLPENLPSGYGKMLEAALRGSGTRLAMRSNAKTSLAKQAAGIVLFNDVKGFKALYVYVGVKSHNAEFERLRAPLERTFDGLPAWGGGAK